MNTNQEDLKLRFPAGRLEKSIIYFFLILQFSLGTLVCVGTIGFLFVTAGASFEAGTPTFRYIGAIPYLVAGTVAVLLLNLLYE